MKKLLIVSHCILNNASKVEQDEVELAGEYELRSELLNLIVENNIQLIQLPCPEFIMYGDGGTLKISFSIHFTRNSVESFLIQF